MSEVTKLVGPWFRTPGTSYKEVFFIILFLLLINTDIIILSFVVKHIYVWSTKTMKTPDDSITFLASLAMLITLNI